MINTECGIFGIISKTPIHSRLCVDGLKKLQHRGRESFGIAYNLKNKFYLEKHMGLVSPILENTMSNYWLGHVRYSTSGNGVNHKFVQPIMGFNDSIGEFIIAHNGNIPEYIWKKLLKKNHELTLNLKENNDTLLLINYIYYLIKSKTAYNWKDIITNIINNIDGAYSIVIQTSNFTYLFRDKNIFKPLIFSKNENNIIISSESCAITTSSHVSDVNVGEILEINNETLDISVLNKPILINKQTTPCSFEYLYFLREKSKVNGINVKDFRIHIGEKLAKQITNNNIINKWKEAIVCGVPTSGICFAKSFSKSLNIEYNQFLELNNDYKYRSFILKTDKERLEACRKKFKLNSSTIKDRIIILVDDSIVRGNTLKYLISYIRSENPKEIHFISGSPPIKYPCNYGIDFPDIEELIVNKIKPENLANYYKIDSLTYLDIHNLSNSNMCKACFNGDYPI